MADLSICKVSMETYLGMDLYFTVLESTEVVCHVPLPATFEKQFPLGTVARLSVFAGLCRGACSAVDATTTPKISRDR